MRCGVLVLCKEFRIPSFAGVVGWRVLGEGFQDDVFAVWNLGFRLFYLCRWEFRIYGFLGFKDLWGRGCSIFGIV